MLVYIDPTGLSVISINVESYKQKKTKTVKYSYNNFVMFCFFIASESHKGRCRSLYRSKISVFNGLTTAYLATTCNNAAKSEFLYTFFKEIKIKSV